MGEVRPSDSGVSHGEGKKVWGEALTASHLEMEKAELQIIDHTESKSQRLSKQVKSYLWSTSNFGDQDNQQEIGLQSYFIIHGMGREHVLLICKFYTI